MKSSPMPEPVVGDIRSNSPDSGEPAVHFSAGGAATSNLDRSREQHWRDLDSFFAKNEAQILKAQQSPLSRTTDSDNMSDGVSVAIDTFTDAANVILQGLTALANVHPALGIAIFAFHGVIQLNLTRRDNDRKVIAVKVEMQTMMCAMFQFRELRHVHLSDDQRDVEYGRLQCLIQRITEEIKACGSDIEYYTERSLVSRVISSKIYEKRFADHVKIFAQRRAELQTVVTVYTAQGVDGANTGILEIGEKINTLDHKIDSILSIFSKLNTPRERDLLQFIKEKGGPEKCIDDDRLLNRLLAMAGESKRAPTAGFDVREQDQQLIDIRKNLRNDLQNLEKILDQNLSRFEHILEMQSNRIEDNSTKLDTITMLLIDQGKVIEKAVSSSTRKSTSIITLEDPVLREMWDRMGFRGKGSVKARTFILNFRDHLSMENRTPAASVYNGSPPSAITGLPPSEEPEDDTQSKPGSVTYSEALTDQFLSAELKDTWALRYLTVSYVHPIIEAIDRDCSGYISVKEANRFAQARPKGKSLISWMAYWAAGWHLNLTQYKKQIYSTILQMHELSKTALPGNKQLIRDYLNSYNYIYLEGLLRSIKSLPTGSDIEEDQLLTEYAENFAKTQDVYYTANMESMKYILRSANDVNCITGGHQRLETWILPVLHILLKRHLDVIILAQKELIHANEMTVHGASLSVIFKAFYDRLHILQAIFQQVYRGNVEPHFEVFAYGMFQTLSKALVICPAESTLHLEEWEQWYQTKDIVAARLAEAPPTTAILAEGPPKNHDYDPISPAPLISNPHSDTLLADTDEPHPLQGEWSCTFRNRLPFVMTIKSVKNGKIEGDLGSIVSSGYMTGDYKTELGTPGGVLDFDAVIGYVHGYKETRFCSTTYDPVREVIMGTWREKQNAENHPGYTPEQFMATRTPIDAYIYRKIIDSPEPEDTSTISLRRWRFALDAVLCRTKARVNSKDAFISRSKGRKSLIKMHYKLYVNGEPGAIYPSLIGEYLKTALVHGLTSDFTWEAHSIYQHVARYHFERMMEDCCPRHITSCDNCRTGISHVRYYCITCTTEKFDNQVDLCEDCRDMDGVNSLDRDNNFVHKTSHSMLRSTSASWVKRYELAWLIPDARLASEKVKARFRELVTNSNRNPLTGGGSGAAHSGESANLKSTPPPNCLFCKKPILALPAWMCMSCGGEDLMCTDCVSSQKEADSQEEHVLLRIFDDVRVWSSEASGMNKAVADELSSLRDGLSGLENRMRTLENRVDTQLAEILNMVTKLVQGNQRPGPAVP